MRPLFLCALHHCIDQHQLRYNFLSSCMKSTHENKLNMATTIGVARDIIVTDASLAFVNGIYRLAEQRIDGVSCYYKVDGEMPASGYVYAILRAPISNDAAGRRWYIGKVPHWRNWNDSTNQHVEMYYCTQAPVGLSEQELLSGGHYDSNVPIHFEWRAITLEDGYEDHTTPDHGNPPHVREWLIDLTAENIEGAAIGDWVHHIEESLRKSHRFDNRRLMRALGQSGRLRLHLQSDLNDVCGVCEERLRNDHRKGTVVGQIGKCKHKFHIICLERCIDIDHFECPTCKDEI